MNFRVVAISYHHNNKELIECAQKFIRSMGGKIKSVQFIVLDMNDTESLNSSSTQEITLITKKPIVEKQ
ncbi:hypothetical protein [Staphylococcus casei]|uniref:Flavodoxin-like domain-containing protein n=1 Tax=Staphylococcus casei TaxID=201828 RepID=A0ABZ2W8A1_9STAP|nr:hypothetical protein AST12_06275 [Staphylococcus succinus]PTI42731.1 hypothetical protein BU056_00345 [Staphylococcus succinus]